MKSFCFVLRKIRQIWSAYIRLLFLGYFTGTAAQDTDEDIQVEPVRVLQFTSDTVQ